MTVAVIIGFVIGFVLVSLWNLAVAVLRLVGRLLWDMAAGLIALMAWLADSSQSRR